MAYRALAIIERGHRGSVETQFADVLYLARELNRQLGCLDMVLRGPAVTLAIAIAAAPGVCLGARRLASLPDPGRSIRSILADGIAVHVETDDLAALGIPAERLVPEVRLVRTGELAARWADYDGVWFL